VLALEAGIDERGDGARDQTASHADGGDDGGRDGRPRQAAAHLTTCRPPEGRFLVYFDVLRRDSASLRRGRNRSTLAVTLVQGMRGAFPGFSCRNLGGLMDTLTYSEAREWRRCSLLGIVVLLLSVAGETVVSATSAFGAAPDLRNWRCLYDRRRAPGTLELLHLHHFGLKRIRYARTPARAGRLPAWPPVHQLRRVRAGARTILGFRLCTARSWRDWSRSAERRAARVAPRVRSRDPKPEWLKVRMRAAGATSR